MTAAREYEADIRKLLDTESRRKCLVYLSLLES